MVDLGIALEVGAGIVAQIVLSARRNGETSQKVADHERDIQNLWSARTKTDERVSKHAERIAAAESKLGINQ